MSILSQPVHREYLKTGRSLSQGLTGTYLITPPRLSLSFPRRRESSLSGFSGGPLRGVTAFSGETDFETFLILYFLFLSCTEYHLIVAYALRKGGALRRFAPPFHVTAGYHAPIPDTDDDRFAG
jgi:hypothetical protein